MKYIATFFPQSWQNDHAIDLDIEAPRNWDVSSELMTMSEEKRSALLHEDHGNGRDYLQQHANAPLWVRTWPGPFRIELDEMEDADADNILPPLMIHAVAWPDLSKSIPDTDGLRGRGFRDALESVRLALGQSGVPAEVINSAVETALEAYGNNADIAEGALEIHEVLMASTAHLLPSERNMLEADGLLGMGTGLVLSMKGEYGYLVYIPSEADADEGEGLRGDLTQHLSQGFAGAMLHAAKLGMNFVRFDADGPVLLGIETYNDDGTVDLPTGHAVAGMI